MLLCRRQKETLPAVMHGAHLLGSLGTEETEQLSYGPGPPQSAKTITLPTRSRQICVTYVLCSIWCVLHLSRCYMRVALGNFKDILND